MIATLLQWIHWIVRWIQDFITQHTAPILVLDNGKRVRAGKLMAEGGFSYVFEAFDASPPSLWQQRQQNKKRNKHTATTRYALKRIHCPDAELVQNCRREASVHMSVHHPHVLPLLGMSITGTDCYMLFPLCGESMRQHVNRHNPFLNNNNRTNNNTTTAPFSDARVLTWFYQIASAVQALHNAGYSHRDVKLENVLLDWTSMMTTSSSSSSSSSNISNYNCNDFHPYLMDFGSAGPVAVPLDSRRQVSMLVEEAATHTTLPYRPPELLEGGVRYCDVATSTSPSAAAANHASSFLDYKQVDVWMLGCTLFAMMYGASPMECEFRNSSSSTGSSSSSSFKIVECTSLRILGRLPQLAGSAKHWYSSALNQLYADLLNHDPLQRPTVETVLERTRRLLQETGVDPSRLLVEQQHQHYDDNEDDDDGIALTSRMV